MVTLERKRIAVFSQRIEGAASGTQSCPALRTMYALVPKGAQAVWDELRPEGRMNLRVLYFGGVPTVLLLRFFAS